MMINQTLIVLIEFFSSLCFNRALHPFYQSIFIFAKERVLPRLSDEKKANNRQLQKSTVNLSDHKKLTMQSNWLFLIAN